MFFHAHFVSCPTLQCLLKYRNWKKYRSLESYLSVQSCNYNYVSIPLPFDRLFFMPHFQLVIKLEIQLVTLLFVWKSAQRRVCVPLLFYEWFSSVGFWPFLFFIRNCPFHVPNMNKPRTTKLLGSQAQFLHMLRATIPSTVFTFQEYF